MLCNITKNYGTKVYVHTTDTMDYERAYNPALCCGALVVGNIDTFTKNNKGYTFLESDIPYTLEEDCEDFSIKNIQLDDGTYLCIKINHDIYVSAEESEEDF